LTSDEKHNVAPLFLIIAMNRRVTTLRRHERQNVVPLFLVAVRDRRLPRHARQNVVYKPPRYASTKGL